NKCPFPHLCINFNYKSIFWGISLFFITNPAIPEHYKNKNGGYYSPGNLKWYTPMNIFCFSVSFPVILNYKKYHQKSNQYKEENRNHHYYPKGSINRLYKI